jgi:hypothetical protein
LKNGNSNMQQQQQPALQDQGLSTPRGKEYSQGVGGSQQAALQAQGHLHRLFPLYFSGRIR